MALQYHGSLGLGACLPIAVQASAQASLALGPFIAELTAKLHGYVGVQAALQVSLPDLSLQIEAAFSILASLQVSPPGITVSLQLEAVFAIIAAIELQIGGLNAAISLIAELEAVLGAAGIHLYSYSGAASGLGSSLAAATAGGLPGGGPSDSCGAVVLATTIGASRIAMSTAFGVSV